MQAQLLAFHPFLILFKLPKHFQQPSITTTYLPTTTILSPPTTTIIVNQQNQSSSPLATICNHYDQSLLHPLITTDNYYNWSTLYTVNRHHHWPLPLAITIISQLIIAAVNNHQCQSLLSITTPYNTIHSHPISRLHPKSTHTITILIITGANCHVQI